MSYHTSWRKFKPNNEGVKEIESYFERIADESIRHIPKEVIHQWLLPHFHEPNSVKNYAWIDLENVMFDLVEINLEEIGKINVIDVNKPMIEEYSPNDFAIWHRPYWRTYGTWQVPPILIDTKSFLNGKPKTSELEGVLQLVEGHNRLATLLMLKREEKFNILDVHKFYVMKSFD